MSVTPGTAAVLLGNTQTLAATVSGSTDTAVSWTVDGVPGGNSTLGTISASGVYAAPADLPTPASVEVRATSHADPGKFSAAQITVTSDISIRLTPGAASVELGAVRSFSASLTSSGHPDPSILWNLTGTGCPAACGTIDASGNYTAPQTMPPSSITVVAQSVADTTKQATAAVTVTSNFTLTISAPASVAAGASVTVSATLQPIAGSNPSTAITWSVSGAGCTGAGCGSLTAEGSVPAAGGGTIASALYAAPATPPNPPSVQITATSLADPSRQALATVTISNGVTVTPAAATRAVNHRITLSVSVGSAANTAVTWNVNGIAGGNAAVGQICAAGSNPCQAVTTSSAAQVDYLAPGAIPATNPVTVQAVSQADTSQSGSAQITIISHIVVTVQPSTVTVAAGGKQEFSATVLGTDNQNVVWQVQGTGCSGTGSPCGTIDANGIYSAPGSAPTPNSLQVVAVSSEDPSQTGTANVSITTGPVILSLLPASVYAGGTAGFTLKAEGSGFQATSPGPGSTLLIGGTARTTTCDLTTECTAPVGAADVASPGNLSVQVKNSDGTLSSSLSLVIAAAPGVEDVIALTAAAPSASGKDIVVVEPTTAGVSLPGASVDLNVAALGLFSTANNSCTLAGNPIPVSRPATGTSTLEVCVFASSGLDTSMTYTVSGPGDVSVIAKQPAGLGIIHLTLQIPSTALTGARTLFIENTNLDKTAASGALEVQ